MRLIILLFALFLSPMLSGCVTISQIDQAFRRVDREWQLEYQRIEDSYRYRVIDAPYQAVYAQVKKTFLDLSMPIQNADFTKGIIVAENEAPHPLTREEWQQVVKVENSRIKRLAGWMFRMADDPKGYVVTVTARLRAVRDKTFVLLDYELDMPKYRRMGITPMRHAPPLAVQLGATKFWTELQSNLSHIDLPVPRRRKPHEMYVAWPEERLQLTFVTSHH